MGRTRKDHDHASASPVIEADSAGPPQTHETVHGEPTVDVPWEQQARLPRRWSTHATRLDRLLAYFWNDTRWFAAFIALAVVSALWGYLFFYGPQFSRVPWYAWLFVPDSPFALTLWIAAAFAVRRAWDRKPGVRGAALAFLAAWAAAVNIKVGLWTPFILLYYPDSFFVGGLGRQSFQALLLVAHLGMVVYALFLMRKMRALPAWAYIGVLGLLFLWDFMDYFFVELFLTGSGIRIYPAGIPDDPGRLFVTTLVTVSLSVASALAVWIGVRLRGPPSPR